MHHTIAWRASIADATAVDLTPVPDPIFAVQNAHFMPTNNWLLQYAYFGAAGPTRARFITPSFRQITSPWIRPVNLGIVPLDESNVMDLRANPLQFRGLEEITLEATQTSGGAAVAVALAGLSRGPIVPMPVGDVFPLRGTGATTMGAGAWTQATITWQDNLPAGRFAVVGMEAISVTGLAARLIFEDQVDRPGCIAQSLISGSGPLFFRNGGLGVWGTFNSNRMPNIELLCNAADTAQEIFLNIVRVG